MTASTTLKTVQGKGEGQPAAQRAWAVRIVAVDNPHVGASYAEKSQLSDFGSRDWVAYRAYDNKHPVYAVGGCHYFAGPTNVWASSGVAMEVLSTPTERFGMALSGVGPYQATSISGSDNRATVPVGSPVLLMAANPNRRCIQIQNLGTQVVYIGRSASMDNAGNGMFCALAAGDSANDGTGGAILMTGWGGPVYGVMPAACISPTDINLAEW